MHGRRGEWSVTVRVTTLKGPLAGAYYVEQLPSYYLSSGEPRGVWFGHGAEQLGLTGEVTDEAFLAVMAGHDPRRPERDLGRRFDDTAVRGFDVTCSAPKPVLILWALGDAGTHASDVVAVDTAGQVTVTAEDGSVYTFDPSGNLATVVSALTANKPTAPSYTNDSLGRVARLTDPVSGKNVRFVYQGGA